ncbi:protein-glutamate O-methyltransferase CheR [bacterium]|nr:protein-glutamate O-methyltransferase CheR [bacterium]
MPRQPLDKNERISPEAEFISNEADYLKFLDRLYNEEGIDLAQYKQNQMRRRINMTIKQTGHNTYCSFLDYAKANENVYRKFIDRITINVSEFIRNPEKFTILETNYLRPMLKGNPNLTIWSAGCSTGEEPYSLALLLKLNKAGAGAKILGWDFDRKALAKAAEGIYNVEALKNVSKDLLDKYFKRLDSERYQVTDELKRLVRFENHNLLEDRFPTGVDIILCRNVVIYFNEQSKRQLFIRFGQALAKNGLLMIGASERIANSAESGLRALQPFFYVRNESDWPETKRTYPR